MERVKGLESGGDFDGFVDIIGQISTLVGFGQQLQAILGGSQPLTIADIETAIQQEVTAALLNQAIETQIVEAGAALQSVQNFLARNYLNAVSAGDSQAQLYALLTGTILGPLFSDMTNNVNALQTWMDKFDESYQSSGNLSDLKTAATGISVCLGTHLYLSIVCREMAKQAPDENERQTQLLNMRSYARAGAQDIGPRLTKLMNVRLASLTYLSDDNPNITDVGGIPITNYCTIDSLHDAWFDAWVFAFKANNDPSMDYAAALHSVMRPSRNLLWSGAQADAYDFSNSLNDGWLQVPGNLGQGSAPWADEFRNTCLDANTALGELIQGARTALLGLDAIALDYPGKEQDNWSWCSSCGGLYYAGAPSVCPAANGGPHVHEQPSRNYGLRCDPTGPAPRAMQDGWRWCKKCSGLFLDMGRRSCAAGGNHDSSDSGLYQLDYSPMPGPDVLGLPDAQDNWRWCTNCSALHFGSGASACPAGGSHDPTGSGNYWLTSLGMLPQPS